MSSLPVNVQESEVIFFKRDHPTTKKRKLQL